jgi:hypothetical protein
VIVNEFRVMRARKRTHSDAQIAAIAASIKEWGWTTPALVGEDGGLIAGHARILAARQLGIRRGLERGAEARLRAGGQSACDYRIGLGPGASASNTSPAAPACLRKSIDRLIPYAKNARTHTDAQVAAIAALGTLDSMRSEKGPAPRISLTAT